MLEGGADLRVIQELLGHSSPTTTQIYTHITQQEALAAYLTHHPRSGPEDGETGSADQPAPAGDCAGPESSEHTHQKPAGKGK